MLETTFLYAFILGGGVLLLQVVLSLFGADDGSVEGGDIDFDAGMDGAEGHSTSAWLFDVISIRTLAAAATFFGLTGIAAQNYELSGPLAIVLATVAGLGAMYAVYWMFRQLYRLESSGAQDIRNAIGRPAEVYLRIPASGGGSGKVHLEMQGRTVEYLAVTEEKEPLDSGTQVFVSGIISSDTLQVTPSDGSLAS